MNKLFVFILAVVLLSVSVNATDWTINLTHFFPFNESSGHPCDYINSVCADDEDITTYRAGGYSEDGYCIELEKDNTDFVKLSGSIVDNKQDYTWIIKIKPKSLTTYDTIINGRRDGDSDDSQRILYYGLTDMNFITEGPDTQASGTSATEPSLNVWSTLIFTYNGSFATWYNNKTVMVNSPATGNSNMGGPFWIGTRRGSDRFVDMYIDDFCVYDRAFTYEEVVEFYDTNASCNSVGAGDPALNFTITAVDYYTQEAIDVFNATVDGIFYNTSTGTITTHILDNHSTLIDLDVDSYSYFKEDYHDYNVSVNLEANLYPRNAINIQVRDEESNNLILHNVSIVFKANDSEITYYTINGTFFDSDFEALQYDILFTVENYTSYSSRQYSLTMGNKTAQELTAYLNINTSETTFTVTDSYTSELLDSVLCSMYRMINESWVPVESKYTNIVGSVTFNYKPLKRYRFYFTRGGYEDYIFYLDPILLDSYDISITPLYSFNGSQDYDKIALVYSPYVFYENQDNNFTFLIQSPYGELNSYGYDITYPSGTQSNSGSNSIGEQLYSNFTITGANFNDTVRVHYYYSTTLAGLREFTYYYPIIVSEAIGNNTMIKNKYRTYGLGLFERLFLSTFFVLLFVGVATLIGQPIAGFGLGMFIFGFMVHIGFIPLWSILISIAIGIIIIGSQPS